MTRPIPSPVARRRHARPGPWLGAGLLALALAMSGEVGRAATDAPAAPAPAPASTRTSTGFLYQHDVVPEQPWSIHVVRIRRARTNFQFRTTLGGDTQITLATVSEQMARLPRSSGRPMVAVNGDYFVREGPYRGDPEGLLIRDGELVSAPSAKSCFWVDPRGEPHVTNVLSSLAVTLPGGEALPVGLNEELPEDRAVLYSPAMGPSTHTAAAREYVLEPDGVTPWLPLRAGATYAARVREVNERGDTPLVPGRLVLAVPRALERRCTNVVPGVVLRVALKTVPDLSGVPVAISGGPALIHDGRRAAYRSESVRHPRTALGWSREEFFLVQVDGRQPSLSVGMTLPELTDYLLKLGCVEALNLDGGGSSTIWVDGHVMNNPCEGTERPTGSALVVVMHLENRGSRTNGVAR